MSLLARFLLASMAVVGLGFIDLHPVNAQTAEKPAKLTVKTYSVADLVVPMDNAKDTSITREAAAKNLMQVITTTVGNKNWQDKGGAGAISFFTNGMALVVRQTEENHKEVGRTLAELRRKMDRKANPGKAERLVRVVYPIADLIAPITNHSVMSDKAVQPSNIEYKDEIGLALVELIANSVGKDTWKNAGGRGSIHYTVFGMALVVEQTADVQNEVEQLLKGLRRVTDLQVAVQVRFIESSGKSAEKIHLMMKNGRPIQAKDDRPDDGRSVQVVFNEDQLFALFKMAASDETSRIRQAPKITMYNGQRAGIDARSEKEPLRSDNGFRFDAMGVASADCNSVRLSLDIEVAAQGGAKEKARSIRIANTFMVPDKNTLVWYAGERDGVHLFVTATPQIAIADEEEQIFLRELPSIRR